MHPKYEQFLRQAEACMAEADLARVPDVRQGWLHLAARWLDMIPPDGVGTRPGFGAAADDLRAKYREIRSKN